MTVKLAHDAKEGEQVGRISRCRVQQRARSVSLQATSVSIARTRVKYRAVLSTLALEHSRLRSPRALAAAAGRGFPRIGRDAQRELEGTLDREHRQLDTIRQDESALAARQ